MSDKIIEDINKYYTDKVLKYGATPQGVDWNGPESQEVRFEQLLKITEREKEDRYSLLDFGCGYGSLYAYINKKGGAVHYIGYDISDEMLKKAQEQFNGHPKWIKTIEKNLKVDYIVASGLFNVKLDRNIGEWETYIAETLDRINSISVKGFAFNILTSYSDPEFMKDYLYYASPEFYFRHCKVKYSKQVSLLHDYGLYEFTILVRK